MKKIFNMLTSHEFIIMVNMWASGYYAAYAFSANTFNTYPLLISSILSISAFAFGSIAHRFLQEEKEL